MSNVNFCASLIAFAALTSCGAQVQKVSSTNGSIAPDQTFAEVAVSGEDARTLFGVMAVATDSSGVKNGVNLSCAKELDQSSQSAAAKYSCNLLVTDKKIGIVSTVEANPTWNEPELVLESRYQGLNVDLGFPYTAHHGIISVHGAKAKSLLETLDVVPTIAIGQGTLKESLRKQGEGYECLRNVWADNSPVSYNCVFYIDYDNGAIRSPVAAN
jgi:hypothetical protein